MFTPKEYSDYEESLHNLWDITNAMNDAESKGFGKGKEEGLQQGLQQGRAEGTQSEKLETAKRMKADGLPINVIAKYTQLSIDDIEKL
jgi:predicted transposase/invertase (TIGR01784 family)